jgi:hypothetical protein
MMVPAAIPVPDSASETWGVPDEHEVIVSVVAAIDPVQATLPTVLVSLYGAQPVPAVEHTSIGWTTTYLVIGTAANAPPAMKQATADNRNDHTIPPGRDLEPIILTLPFRRTEKLSAFNRPKCELVHTWPGLQPIFLTGSRGNLA